MTRLTNPMREVIQRGMIKHAFAGRVEAHRLACEALATEVYEHLLEEPDRRRIDALPSGWVPSANMVTVQLGDSSRDTFQVSFNGTQGSWYGAFSRATETRPAEVERRVTYRMSKNTSLVAEGPLAERVREASRVEQQLKADIEAAERTVLKTLESFTTVPSLVKGWPEAEPFAKRYVPVERTLPVIPREQLNGLLDLPVASLA